MSLRRTILFTLAVVMLVCLAVWMIKTTQAQSQSNVDGKDDMRSASNPSDTIDHLASFRRITGLGKRPRVGPNIQVNAPQQGLPNGLLGRSETTIVASDPDLDGLLVAGFNDAQGFCGALFGAPCPPENPGGLSGYAFSTDGGNTWTDGGAPPVINNAFSRGDPWMDRGGGFDSLTFYFANLSVDATTGNSLGVSVHRGQFSGSTFAWSDIRLFNAPNAPNDGYDKEAIAAAKDGSGAAYVSVTNFIARCGIAQFGFGQIEVWRTHDAGDTWQGPAIVSPDQTFITTGPVPPCGTTGISQQSSVPAIGPEGEVYVAWQFGPTFNPGASTDASINVAASFDGGVTFETPVTVANINSLRGAVPVAYNRDRINDHPRIAVATTGRDHNDHPRIAVARTGRDHGRVYVAYASAVAPTPAGAISPCPAPNVGQTCREQRLTSIQVFVAFSDDQGQTWTSVPVAPAPPATGLKRWWPVVTLEPGGNIDVIYYESVEAPVSSGAVCNISVAGGANRRRGPAHSLVDTFWAQSTDGGATFNTPVKVTTITTDWCTVVSNIRPSMGDYIGSFSGGNRVFPVWADGRNGVPDTFYSTGKGSGKSH